MGDIALLPGVSQFLRQRHGNYINGCAVAGSGEELAVINPATGKVLASVTGADQNQVNEAMQTAKKAWRVWCDIPALQRGTLLLKLADILSEHREELAQLESLCSGKVIMLSRMLEIDQSVAFLRYFAGWAGKISGETLDVSLPSVAGEKYRAFTFHQSLGVVVGIIPWNFSIMIAIWKLAAALICGCTVVLKPSEYTPLTLLRLAALAKQAGLPDGVINIVNGRGATLGQQLISHADCAKVSFTGSVASGNNVNLLATQQGKRVTLELGGKNAALFLADLDADTMVNGIIEAGYLNQGQICAAAECFYLPRAKMEQVLTLLKTRLATLRIGSPLDEQTEMGPLANRMQFNKVLHLIDKARAEGGEIIYGGQALAGNGFFIQPTAIRVTNFDSCIMQEETFGPVGCFIAYDDEQQALQQINRSPFGLAASVWTQNISKALRFSSCLEAGMVWVNMHTFLDPAVPFGGIKGSGIGREFGSAFIDDYTQLKSVMLRY